MTPKTLYLNRRQFLRAAGISSAAILMSACTKTLATTQPVQGADDITAKETALSFNNFYEFSLSKSGVASAASKFTTTPWSLEVSGLVEKPLTFDMETLKEKFKVGEHIYRMRCVEGWSMVLPWYGFAMKNLLDEVLPAPEAKYLRFTSAFRPDEMPGIAGTASFPWPYTEGLRIDEAMHPLTLMATGLYGEDLTKQNGAPLRLVVPWKYGFKSSKSITKMEFTAQQPQTFWNSYAAHEYGFYANVNPAVDHPRWSQADELRLGEKTRRPTLLFNGYDELADLYKGLDLKTNF
ncbi:MAG: protein-methionine-sulfoxide reductase catalytic subunit MsrP [Anaerolineaceae bacterium]|nr:protein-methionine-sulfoxide reductase catalytic subunit MsrP [Anaerolineaceae bacterium]